MTKTSEYTLVPADGSEKESNVHNQGPLMKKFGAIDSENAYNLEYDRGLGTVTERELEEKAFRREVIDSSEAKDISEAEGIEKFMIKYDLEKFEVIDWGKKCDAYKYFGGKQPLTDYNDVTELHELYRDYLSTENENGLALSQVEQARLSAGEMKTLLEAHEKLSKLLGDEAEIKAAVDADEVDKIIDESNRELHNQKLAYTTDKKIAREVVEITPEQKERRNRLVNTIIRLENKAIMSETKSVEAGTEMANYIKSMDDKFKKELNKIDENGPETLALFKSCFDFYKRDLAKPMKHPVFLDGSELNREQILEGAQGHMEAHPELFAKANFEKTSHEKKGKVFEELVSTQKTFKMINGRRVPHDIKYIVNSNRPAGSYYFQLRDGQALRGKDPHTTFVFVDRLDLVPGENKRLARQKSAAKTA